jgi:hypothetical protein
MALATRKLVGGDSHSESYHVSDWTTHASIHAFAVLALAVAELDLLDTGDADLLHCGTPVDVDHDQSPQEDGSDPFEYS